MKEKITFEMPKELKAEVKAISARRYMTVKEWLLRVIGQAVLEEYKNNK